MKQLKNSLPLVVLSLLAFVGCNPDDEPLETPTVPESVATGYRHVFTQGLPQNTITNRISRNLELLEDPLSVEEMEYFPVAGLHVLLPPGFERSQRFTGFEDKASGTWFTINANPFPMIPTTTELVAASMKGQGKTILLTQEIEIDGRKGVLYGSRNVFSGQVIAAFTLAFGSDESSWILTATMDPKREEQLGERLLRSLVQTRISERPRAPDADGVNFTITPNRLTETNGFVDKLVFCKDGKFPLKDSAEPVFQVGRSPLQYNVSDRRAYAKQRVTPGATMGVQMISLQNEITIDGLEGYEFLAVGNDRISGEPLQIYSVTLFDGKVNYQMNAWCSAVATESYLPDFRELAKSFKRKPQSQ